jgi:hypothetical protein
MADYKLDLTASEINQALKDIADKLSRYAVSGEEKTQVLRINSNHSVEVIRENKLNSIARIMLGDYGFVQDRMHDGNYEDAINYRTCFLHNCYIDKQDENRYKAISKWIPSFKIEFGNRKIRFATVPTTAYYEPDEYRWFWEGQWQTILELDPLIGIIFPSNAWNGNHMVMGTFHFWVDADGKLRIKNGAPTSDIDGSIVGSQS